MFTGAPARAPSRSTTCSAARALLDPAPRGVERVGVEGGLALVVALDEPHRAAVADVDRRVEDQAGDRVAQIAREVGEQPQAGGARLLRVELDAVERRARDRAGEALAVRGACRARRSASRRAAARSSGRSRTGVAVGEPVGQLATRAPSAPAPSRCAGPSAPARRARSTSPSSRPSPGAPPSSVEDSNRSWKPEADAEHRACRPRRRSATSRVEPELADPLHRLAGTRRRPGRTRPSALARRVVVGGDHGLGADALERLLDRAQVAHPVVEDRDPCVIVERALGRRHAGLVGVDRDRLAQRPGERLEAGLDQVVGVGAVAGAEVQRQLRVRGDGAEELLGQLGVEAGDRDRRQLGLEQAERPPRDVDRAHRRAPRPSAPPRSRSGGSRRGRRAPRRAPGRARCRRPRPCGGRRSRGRRSPRPQPEPAVAAEQLEHVVEEADAGRRRDLAAVEVELERDLGLARLALDPFAVRARRVIASPSPVADSPWTGKPSARGDRGDVGRQFVPPPPSRRGRPRCGA